MNNESKLGLEAMKILSRQEEINQLQDRIGKVDRPGSPDGPISYDEATRLQAERDKYKTNIERLENQIKENEEMIEDYEAVIRDLIPAQNVDISVTANYEGDEHKLLIRHVKSGSDDFIDIREV